MPAPSSIVPIDIACSFRIDRCTCVPGPSRPGHAPRTGPPASAFRIVRQPRGGPRPPPETRPQRRRPVAGLARLCCENIAETGGILSADPPRAQEADKNGPLAAGTHLANHRGAGRKADHLTGLGKGNYRAAEADPDVCASELLP